MPKFFSLFFFLLSIQLLSSTIKIYGESIYNDSNRTIIKGGVNLFKDDIYIWGDNAIFFNDLNKFEFFGNVVIKKRGFKEVVSDYLVIDLNNSEGAIDNIFFPSQEDNVWISSKEGYIEQNGITLNSIVCSSCKPSSPDWSIKASSGEYNKEYKWVHLYNPTFYAGRVPVFYLPYFGFPTDKTRRSGLLPPRFGVSKIEGYLFEQPLYIAPSENYDFELWGQIRSDRGVGYAGKFRFADSYYSKGFVSLGEFKDKDTFVKEHDIQNKTHGGFELEYERNNIFTDNKDYIDRLYFSWKDYSDVEYIRLESADFSKRNRSISQIIANEFNYYIKNDDYFLLLYGKHFKDLSDPNRKDLVQQYPNLQVHKFSSVLFSDSLLFSSDYKFKAFDREQNLTATDHTLSFPFTYYTSFFDDFLRLSYTYNLRLYKIEYDQYDDNFIEDGTRVSSKHKIELASNLGKQYDDKFHSLNFWAAYIHPDLNKKDGYFSQEFVETYEENEAVDLKFSQYFYDQDYDTKFIHRINQSFVNKDKGWISSDLIHETVFEPYANIYFKNNFNYSYDYKKIMSSSSTLSLYYDSNALSVTYLYGLSDDAKYIDQKYYSLITSSKINSKNYLKLNMDYDDLDSEIRSFSVEYIYKKNCWNTSLKLSRTIDPITTSLGTTSKTNDIIYISFEIVPLGQHQLQVFEDEK